MSTALYQAVIQEMGLSPDDLRAQLSNEIRILNDDHGIAAFLKTSKKLMICGDYDCDGIMATAIACQLAEALKIPYGYYIPNRLTEGYGTSIKTIELAYQKGYSDLLLVDNGVKANEAVTLAKKLGMRVAIVDHHNYDEKLAVDAFLHPELCDAYFHDMSAGALIACVAEKMDLLSPKILAMAAVATIADVMPLWGKNREWVKRAVPILQAGIPAFDLLLPRTRYTRYSSTVIAFQLVPKINSIGRLSDRANVNTAVQYFLSEDDRLLETYSKQVHDLNALRKDMSQALKEDALTKINGEAIQIIVGEDYHEGLLGIVANQIMSQTQRPTIMLTDYKNYLKGSARSSSISLKELFAGLDPHYFLSMGGHDFAYGMTLDAAYFDHFKEAVQEQVLRLPDISVQKRYLDVALPDINPAAISELKQLEPFGTGFELPLLALTLDTPYQIRKLGNAGYKFIFSHGPLQEALYFNPSFNPDQSEVHHLLGRLDLDQINKITMILEKVF